jgi:hypothetical protein
VITEVSIAKDETSMLLKQDIGFDMLDPVCEKVAAAAVEDGVPLNDVGRVDGNRRVLRFRRRRCADSHQPILIPVQSHPTYPKCISGYLSLIDILITYPFKSILMLDILKRYPEKISCAFWISI